MTRGARGITRDRWAICIAVLGFGVYVAHDAGRDAAIDEQSVRGPRIGMTYVHFMEQCGRESIIRKRDYVEGHAHVVIVQSDWLICMQDGLTKDSGHGMIISNKQGSR